MTGLISLQPKGLSRVFSNTTIQNHQFFLCSAFFIFQLSHPCIRAFSSKTYQYDAYALTIYTNFPNNSTLYDIVINKYLLKILFRQKSSALVKMCKQFDLFKINIFKLYSKRSLIHTFIQRSEKYLSKNRFYSHFLSSFSCRYINFSLTCIPPKDILRLKPSEHDLI